MPTTARVLAPSVSAHFRIDRGFRIRSWPERASALLGWDREEALGKDLFALLGCEPDPAAEPLRAWLPCRFLSRKRHRDGSLLSTYVAFEPGVDEHGNDCGMLLLDRVDAELEPLPGEAEALHQTIIASMHEGVVVQGRGGEILSCNQAAERILGLSADQLRGRSSIDPRWRSVHEDGSPFAGEDHPAMVTMRTGVPQEGVVMGVHKPDGSLAWLRIHVQPIRLAPSAPHHAVVTTFLDITEERRLLHELRAQREQLALVFEGNDDGSWDWEVPTGRVAFSRRWAGMLGYQLEELAPELSTWQRLTHPEDLPRAMAAVEAHLAGQTAAYEAEFRMRHKNGDWLWILDRGKVVQRAHDGAPLRAAGTHTDVTACRQADERLQALARANEELVAELRSALDRVRRLSGLLPVCAWCKSVRNDQGYWQHLEDYLSEHTDARLTHGLCPTCSGQVLR
ncbi:MAG: PAS domain-containing protein [Planctomycetes bacterium]|nr:PAS domain-containing protein [Planctomycetota bacterium]MCC7396945.1 PAS domain-containing protein [Planctomycetota bacterium]